MSAIRASSDRISGATTTAVPPIPRSRISSGVTFYSLLSLIALTAIPYGAVEPWWRSVFQCLVFVIAMLFALQTHRRCESHQTPRSLTLPVIALVGFTLAQSLPRSDFGSGAGTISADPFQTRLFAVHLCALILAGWLLLRHANSDARVGRVVETLIGVGFGSALFGLLRQASQHRVGFFLPNLRPGSGYGQFINPNHVAFLMEMASGLALGLVVARGVRGRRAVVYVAAAVSMWVAIVLSNSRGGIFSLLCQIIFLVMIFLSCMSPSRTRVGGSHSWWRGGRLIVVRGLLVIGLVMAATFTVVSVGGDPLADGLDRVEVELNRQTADSYVLRQNIWRATWDLIKAHPFVGTGFGGYWIAVTRYHKASGDLTPQEAHNDYLELTAGGGIVGVAIVAAFAVALGRAVRKQIKFGSGYRRAVALAALAGIVPVIVHSMVDFGLHITVNALMFTVLIGLAALDCGSKSTGENSV